jgi:hypothetical protein
MRQIQKLLRLLERALLLLLVLAQFCCAHFFRTGLTPLHQAAYNGHTDAACILILVGANTELPAKSNGYNPQRLAQINKREAQFKRAMEVAIPARNVRPYSRSLLCSSLHAVCPWFVRCTSLAPHAEHAAVAHRVRYSGMSAAMQATASLTPIQRLDRLQV